ncbi:MAG TPA: ATP-binding cassette domain-containing protein [Clostridiaceae bacterium]|nr:ATP-binding cassette domain-containing protein [Clostridiaceae bacterium]
MRLEVCNINKSFSGKQILHNVSFKVESGRAMGFLGRNGAGKTTTIRVLMNVFEPDSGELILDGKPFNRKDYKIGYLPEERGMYAKISILDQLVYFGQLKHMSKADAKKSAIQWLERVDLLEYAKKTLDTLSKGNQQKIQILQAVIDDPDILILDEPFSGLDPVNAQVLKDLIREFITKNRIVIFSSHQMGHVEEFCDDVTFIQNGRIILSDNLRDIKRKLGKNKLRIRISDLSLEESQREISRLSDVKVDKDRHSLIVECLRDKTANQVLSDIIYLNLPIELFSFYEPSLEEIFIRLESGDTSYNQEEGPEGGKI